MAEGDFDPDFPFAGLRVLELAQGIAAPGAGALLVAYGADVVKVEDLNGDWSRHLGKTFESVSPTFLAGNRGKRSLALDLRDPAARDILGRLALRADVLIQNFRPGILGRLGLDAPVLMPLNPRLVYASLTGFGEEGPYRDRAATDSVVQAISGILGPDRSQDGPSQDMPIPIVDLATALNLFQAIAMALFVREKTGKGRHLPVNLLETAAWLQAGSLAEYVATDGKPGKLAVPRAVVPTRDGKLAVIVIEDAQFARLCEAIGRAELTTDPRFASAAARIANEAELMALLQARFREKPTAEWAGLLAAADVLHAPVNDLGAFLADPHVAAGGFFAWVTQPGMGRLPLPHVMGAAPFADEAPAMTAPALGQHSRAVLEEIGLEAAAVDRLLADGIVGAPEGA
ncbi:MAG: CoA transferase [Alphaproteobacteria bacterium]|nr:CoA transferase [Alphaproteobacteria bacterium]